MGVEGHWAKIKFLPNYDAQNGWHNILPEAPPVNQLASDQQSDWLVIGAGLSGLSAARRLAEHFPDKKITLIEAARVGQGASGRNAGFAIDLPFIQESRGSMERAHRIHRLHRAGAQDLNRLVNLHNIDCDWSQRGKFMVATSDYATKNLYATQEFLKNLGEPSDLLGRDALAERLGTRCYKIGLYSPGTYLMNPAALTRGLAASMPDNVTVYENSPIQQIQFGKEIIAETLQGKITAGAAIVAANGFTENFGFYRRKLFNVMSFASLTRPLTEEQQTRLGGTRDWGVHPVGAAGATIRRTLDERIWLRTSFRYTPEIHCKEENLQRYEAKNVADFKTRFPMLGEPDFEYTSGGGLCFSQNQEPIFEKRSENLFIIGCQNAIGVSKSTIHGRLIADWAAGCESELLQDAQAYGKPSQLPPEPFLGIGVRARFAFEKWKGENG
jgi:glycine/D-amino acid oxidase-like deaminating enzyme